jgi:hypothetical protein
MALPVMMPPQNNQPAAAISETAPPRKKISVDVLAHARCGQKRQTPNSLDILALARIHHR